jgi:tetratricopeptide (TPR) repeat protein
VIQNKFRYREAYEYAKKAISKDDTYWPAYYTAGSNALRLGLAEEGRSYLENAFEVDQFNVRCYNALQLMDYMDREYETIRSKHFTLRMKTSEVPFLKHIAQAHLESYLVELTKRYKMTPRYPITVEFFADHKDFSARTVGLPGIGASGACFGEFVTQISPRAMSPAIASWIVTLRHEFAHVITLQKTKNRIPRWFTEGLSVYEEAQFRSSCQRLDEYMFLSALFEGKLLPLKKLDSGFTKPKWRMQVLLCYYHGYVIVEFIKQKYGFEKIIELLDAFGNGLVLEKAIESVFGQTPDEFDKDFFAYAKKRYGKCRVAPHLWPDTVSRMKVSIEKGKTAEKYAKLARAYLRVGKDADVEINLHRAMKIDKDSPEVHLVQGLRFMGKGERGKAKKAFHKAIALGVHDLFTAHVNLALIAQKEEKPEVQENELLAALEAFPRAARQPVNVYAMLVALYKKQNQNEKMIDMLEKWCALNCKLLGQRKILAKHYHEKKMYEKLEPILEDLTFLNPFDNSIAPMMVECYYAGGEYEEVVRLSDLMAKQKIYKCNKITPGCRH